MNFVNWNFMQNIVLHIFVSSIESIENITYSAIIIVKYIQISHIVGITVLNVSSRSDLIVYDTRKEVKFTFAFLMKEQSK